jgi:hypothetical protein
MSETSLAAADLRGDRLIVYSSSQTKDGFWVTNGTFEILDVGPPDSELGVAVLRMLDASRSGVRTPDLRRIPSPFTPVLEALGVRSWAAYARGVRHVHIERQDRVVELTPSRNGGSKEGFVGLTCDVTRLDDPTAAALATALRTAFTRSA